MITFLLTCILVVLIEAFFPNFFSSVFSVLKATTSLAYKGIVLLAFGTLIYGGVYFVLFCLGWVK